MKFKLTGKFGELAPVHGSEAHHGIDIATPMNTTIRSIGDGTVQRITHYGNQNIGNGVIVHDDKTGNFDIYGHLSKIKVHVGQKVHEGTTLGQSGSSGHSSGPHLHFGIQSATDGHFIDPTPQLNHLEAITGDNWNHGYIGGHPTPGTALDSINKVSDWLVHKEGAAVKAPTQAVVNSAADGVVHDLGVWATHELADLLNWFTVCLPDLMGYITILAGMLIIISSMISSKHFMKVIGGWAGSLIFAILWLVNAKS